MNGSIDVIGLSVSGCIRDLARGLVPLASVKKIIGGTALSNIEELWIAYHQDAWKDCGDKAREILFTLHKAGKIDQPRLRGEPPPDSRAGIWKIDDLYLNTPELRDLLSISDYFLQMSQGHRNKVLEYLPPDVLEQFLHNSNQAKLRKLFPDLAGMVKTVPADQLYFMVINRLKHFYQNATDMEKLLMHPHVMRILTPFLKHKRALEKQRPAEPAPQAPMLSQIRRFNL